MVWILVLIAGLFEIAFATALKASDGFRRLWPTLTFIACAACSLALLSTATRTLPIGSAYAVWTGIGAAGTAVIGMVVLGEARSAIRLVAIGAIIAGVIGLQLTSGGH